MKTAELEGAMLDYWVAQALGWRKSVWSPVPDDWDWRGPVSLDDTVGGLMAGPEWSPSTDWAHGGPLIEVENISVINSFSVNWDAIKDAVWGYDGPEGDFEAEGKTPLIAAMRAYVSSKFGDEVPDELPKD